MSAIELNLFAVGKKRQIGACGSPRSPGCGSRTSTASRMVIHDMRPPERGVNCRILPIIPVRVEIAINRSGSHRQISVKLTVSSTREGEVRSEATWGPTREPRSEVADRGRHVFPSEIGAKRRIVVIRSEPKLVNSNCSRLHFTRNHCGSKPTMTNSTTGSIDATLFGMPVRTGRWAFVLAGMLMNVYLGAVYAWSVFRTPVAKLFS